MTCISDINSSRHLSPRLAAGLVLSAFLVLGTSLASASAEGRRDDHRGGDRHGDWHGGGGGGGGYYPAPPVVYGTPILCSTAGGLRPCRRRLSAGRHHRHSVTPGCRGAVGSPAATRRHDGRKPAISICPRGRAGLPRFRRVTLSPVEAQKTLNRSATLASPCLWPFWRCASEVSRSQCAGLASQRPDGEPHPVHAKSDQPPCHGWP